MCFSTSGHDTTMASSYGKTISISTIIIIILPSLSFTSNKTPQLFHWGSHTKSVCVRSRTEPKVSIAATQWAHEQNAFVISFSVFHSSSLSISTTEESRIVKQNKKWKLFLISTCELFFTFFYVVSSLLPPHKLSRSSLRLIFVNETRKKLEKKRMKKKTLPQAQVVLCVARPLHCRLELNLEFKLWKLIIINLCATFHSPPALVPWKEKTKSKFSFSLCCSALR